MTSDTEQGYEVLNIKSFLLYPFLSDCFEAFLIHLDSGSCKITVKFQCKY